MMQRVCAVRENQLVAENIYVLRLTCGEIAGSARAGQFINVRTADGIEPLLRRPFSIYRTEGDDIEIIYNVVGKGTGALSRKRRGDALDVLGPLGVPFSFGSGDFETALLIGGGLGVAPLPMATSQVKALRKPFLTFLGSRTARYLAIQHLEHLHVATDDGTAGYHGNVVELLEESDRINKYARPKVFACGPTPMLRAVARFAEGVGWPCEVSLEGAMGCGFGICQGCPVELVDGERTYALMCKDGPVFDARKIRIA